MTVKLGTLRHKNLPDPTAPEKYYAIAHAKEVTDIDGLSKLISDKSTISRPDVYAVIAALPESIIKERMAGRSGLLLRTCFGTSSVLLRYFFGTSSVDPLILLDLLRTRYEAGTKEVRTRPLQAMVKTRAVCGLKVCPLVSRSPFRPSPVSRSPHRPSPDRPSHHFPFFSSKIYPVSILFLYYFYTLPILILYY